MKQRTLAKTATYSGTGLHTGSTANLTLKPAPPDTGIVFVRTDLPERVEIPAQPESVAQRPMQTALAHGGVEVQTVEHLLSALYGLGISNLYIEIDCFEMPGADGSAKEYVQLIKTAGIKEYEQEVPKFVVTEPISITNGDISLVALPSKREGLSCSYTLHYDHPQVGVQHCMMDLDEESFVQEIAAARTFCMEEEAQAYLAQGLGKGANYKNTLVIGKEGVIENHLRYPDEIARHKILDMVGDLAILGARIHGHLVAIKSGHATNFEMVKAMKVAMERKFKPRDHGVFDISTIRKILPHRYPFLLVDRILELDPGKSVLGVKNVTANEEFFRGHFPERPVMPGMLQIEALAQVSAMLLVDPENDDMDFSNQIAFLMTVNRVKFRRIVVPGDQLMLKSVAKRIRGKIAIVEAQALVDDQVVSEAEIKFMVIDK